ncbi:hypothetical protein Tco_0748218 [Tanacetum coccineum]|uniref:Uncharacterized protein n=1 Tax=Tanacetum coccineum TaxID=301880 RepID=A0ABQ4YVS6_9ASTR
MIITITQYLCHVIISEFDCTQKLIDEIGELRAISGHMLGAAGVQIPENNLDDMHSSREEDGTSETLDPQDLMGLDVSLSRAVDFLRGTSVVVVILVKGQAFPTIVKVRPLDFTKASTYFIIVTLFYFLSIDDLLERIQLCLRLGLSSFQKSRGGLPSKESSIWIKTNSESLVIYSKGEVYEDLHLVGIIIQKSFSKRIGGARAL